MDNTILSYALNAEKKLVHIDSVKNGLECGCVCPGCKEPLVAKNDGKIREHHFAHVSGNDCGTGYQTIRHIWGKELIVANQQVPVALNGKKGFIKTNRIGMEVNLTELNIIPDVFANIEMKYSEFGIEICRFPVPCIVEIYVTHKVDDEKSSIIKKAGIPAIEIDLSKSSAMTKEELAKDLYNQENWSIINDKVGAQFTAGVQGYVNSLLNAYRGAIAQPTYRSTPRRQGYHRSYRKNRRF